MSAITLGAFELLEPIARGGMGVVWRGVHTLQQVPVAIKVLTTQASRDPRFLAAFQNEVRAMAGLGHPHVVLVLDYGAVTMAAENASEGRLVAGSPYLVMELLQGGSLRQTLGRPTPWHQVRDILLCLLDALSHAHARGVIHLDIKPDNVLFGSQSDTRPGLKLTDFGLAQAVLRQDAEQGALFAGTPLYMAPEQFGDRWRDYGPWTDLYALGVLAFTLLQGAPPFPEKDYGALQQAHLWSDIPRLKLRMVAPAGVEEWVRRLLEKDPGRRFVRAADAAWALLDLGEAPELVFESDPYELIPDSIFATGAQPTAIQALLTLNTAGGGIEPEDSGDEPEWLEVPFALPEDVTTDPGVDDEDIADEETSPIFGGVPPMPLHWDSPAPPSPSIRLLGAGLSLYWLRSLPLVDRETERDALWGTLRDVRDLRHTRAVVLQGPHGCGKSRLAEWLCERAHEVGSATWMRAIHSPAPTASDGLAPMVARALRCTNLARPQVEGRLEVFLRRHGVDSTDEWQALTELISPLPESERGGGFAFTKPMERYGVVRRHLERICAERPVIVWIDDAQWGADALRFALYLMDERRRSSLPVMLVVTIREEALYTRPEEARLLTTLMDRRATISVDVGPLPLEHRASLVRELLSLEPALADEVATRTAGNPLFAVQLVGDWVQRGQLVLAEGGFRLRDGGLAQLPDDLHKVWERRIGRVLETLPPEDGRALELAATLGQDVSTGEWELLCAHEGIPASRTLVERLLAERLVRSADGNPDMGWSFVHGMLRESLERRARELGRQANNHRVAAAVLDGRSGLGNRERVGRHLLLAGDRVAAVDALLQGARERRAAGDNAIAEGLLAEREAVMHALELPESDPRWGFGWVLQARLALLRQNFGGADARAAEAELAARIHGWPLVLALALRERGKVANDINEFSLGTVWLREAAGCATALGDRELRAKCYIEMGDVLTNSGALDDALAAFREALGDFESLGHVVEAATAHRSLAVAAYQAGRLDEAVAEVESALAPLERSGQRAAIAYCQNLLGDILRSRGDFLEAESAYLNAIACFRDVDSTDVIMPMINLGLSYTTQGRYAEARPVLEDGLHTVRANGRRAIEGCVHICLLPCLAAVGDWEAWDRHLAQGEVLLVETGFVETDIARMAEHASELAFDDGYHERARRVLAIAEHQFRVLERTPELLRVQARLGMLSPAAAG